MSTGIITPGWCNKSELSCIDSRLKQSICSSFFYFIPYLFFYCASFGLYCRRMTYIVAKLTILSPNGLYYRQMDYIIAEWPILSPNDLCSRRMTYIVAEWPMLSPNDLYCRQMAYIIAEWPILSPNCLYCRRMTYIVAEWPILSPNDLYCRRMTYIVAKLPILCRGEDKTRFPPSSWFWFRLCFCTNRLISIKLLNEIIRRGLYITWWILMWTFYL
jgi:hypothetical protein